MDIEKRNELIANFMRVGHLYEAQSSNGFNKYHESWDKLMPVVKKLLDLDNDNILLEKIPSAELTAMGIMERILVNSLKRSYTTIDDTYKAVVGYIKWYNENK